jgi:hypothetical protein
VQRFQRGREAVEGVVERPPEAEVREGRGEPLHALVEAAAEGEGAEGMRERPGDARVEPVAEREDGEVGWEFRWVGVEDAAPHEEGGDGGGERVEGEVGGQSEVDVGEEGRQAGEGVLQRSVYAQVGEGRREGVDGVIEVGEEGPLRSRLTFIANFEGEEEGREVRERLVEFCPQSKVCEGGRKGRWIEGLVEVGAEVEELEGGKEGVDGLIECVAKSEVGDGRG